MFAMCIQYHQAFKDILNRRRSQNRQTLEAIFLPKINNFEREHSWKYISGETMLWPFKLWHEIYIIYYEPDEP